MKTARAVAIVLVVFALIVWGIGRYLGPDDLRSCQETPDSNPGCEKADAIVAISGGDTAARADEAIKLYQHGWADTIVFSGAAADKSGPSNAEVMASFAVQAGVPATDIIIESRSKTTSENALETKDIFAEYGIKTAILVTSAYHQRRALLEFDYRVSGVEFRSHPVHDDNQWSSSWWWATPTGWWLALQELVGSFVTAAKGATDA